MEAKLESHDLESLSRDIRRLVSENLDAVSVHFFGSLAVGSGRAGSDLDLAVLFRVGSAAERMLDACGELGERLEALTGRRVDVVPLNLAHPSVAFRAVRGRLLFDRDPVARSLFTARTISRYHAYRRFFAAHAPALEKRAAEGRLGAPG